MFDILTKAKKCFPLSNESLCNIQMQIEDLTMLFDEKSMFKSAPNIIKILIRNDEVSAKDYSRLGYRIRILLNCFRSSVNIRLRH